MRGMDAESIAKGCGNARPSGEGWQCSCPVPSHGKGRGDRNPSLFIKDGFKAPLPTCYVCDRLDVIQALRDKGLWGDTPRNGRPPPAPKPIVPAFDRRACDLWQKRWDIRDTLAETYLRSRGLTGPFHYCLRLLRHPDRPAMIALVQDADKQPLAVQLTYLTNSGRLNGSNMPRQNIGRLHSGAVHLGHAGPVIGLTEGIEDALSVTQMKGVTCWATLGAQRLDKIRFPAVVKELHLYADNDKAGRDAADRAVRRYEHDGYRVKVRFPPGEHKDWNAFLISTRRGQ